VSKIAGLRGSVVLEGNLESTVRTSSWNSEARPQTAIDGCQKMLELLCWYEENRLLIGVKRSTMQVEATGKTTSVSRSTTLIKTFQSAYTYKSQGWSKSLPWSKKLAATLTCQWLSVSTDMALKLTLCLLALPM